MTYRPPEHFVHGLNGPVVLIPARVAALLETRAGLNRFRMDIRGADPEVDAVLVAVHLAALTWRTATGSDPRNTEEQPAEFPDMSTRVAADTLGITERGVRQAITRGHLHATRVDGRWRITRENLAHFQAARTAA